MRGANLRHTGLQSATLPLRHAFLSTLITITLGVHKEDEKKEDKKKEDEKKDEKKEDEKKEDEKKEDEKRGMRRRSLSQ